MDRSEIVYLLALKVDCVLLIETNIGVSGGAAKEGREFNNEMHYLDRYQY
jgi:hypothetical protein